jgi:Reverse transcriptase (RNA-dependent DNA polymerase)
VAEEEFAALEKAGIVSRSTSPLHMVPKKDGSWRPCGDYRRLNTITMPDRYPLPNLMDLSANMDGCTVFSKIDLVKAFHQVPIAPEERKKSAVITTQNVWTNKKVVSGSKKCFVVFLNFEKVQQLIENVNKGKNTPPHTHFVGDWL